MNLLIKLASLILISLSLHAQASSTVETFKDSIKKLETSLGREITPSEHESLAQLLLFPQTVAPHLFQQANASSEGPSIDSSTESLKMGCLQGQIAGVISVKLLGCISEDAVVYSVIGFDIGILLLANGSAMGLYIQGPPSVLTNIRTGRTTNFEFVGIGASVYWGFGGQALYYRGPSHSTLIMGGIGYGFGGGVTFATIPHGFILSRWGQL